MADFTAQDVQELRKSTGAGIMDAKRSLVATGGDMAKAADYLREKGIAKAAKRSGREQGEGESLRMGAFCRTLGMQADSDECDDISFWRDL